MTTQMNKEIEVKYLLYENGVDYTTDEFKKIYSSISELEKKILKDGYIINQGYLPVFTGLEIAKSLNLNVDFEPSVARLRSKLFDNYKSKEYYFALKGKGMISRDELEPKIDKYLFYNYWYQTEGKRIKKVRLELPHKFYKIEFDTYIDDRPDLIVAEIEVKKLLDIKRIIPLGKDVSNDPKYKNDNLAQ